MQSAGVAQERLRVPGQVPVHVRDHDLALPKKLQSRLFSHLGEEKNVTGCIDTVGGTMEQPIYSTGDVARLLGIKCHQIAYAITNGYVPEPGRFCGKRSFGPDDVMRLAKHFGIEQRIQITQEGGICFGMTT
jgi:hypothetical protein